MYLHFREFGSLSYLFIYGLAIPFAGLAMEWLYYGIEEYAYITKRVIVFRIIGPIIISVFAGDGYGAAIASVISEALIAFVYYLYGYYKGEKVRFLREIYLYEVIFAFQVAIWVILKIAGFEVKNQDIYCINGFEYFCASNKER